MNSKYSLISYFLLFLLLREASGQRGGPGGGPGGGGGNGGGGNRGQQQYRPQNNQQQQVRQQQPQMQQQQRSQFINQQQQYRPQLQQQPQQQQRNQYVPQQQQQQQQRVQYGQQNQVQQQQQRSQYGPQPRQQQQAQYGQQNQQQQQRSPYGSQPQQQQLQRDQYGPQNQPQQQQRPQQYGPQQQSQQQYGPQNQPQSQQQRPQYGSQNQQITQQQRPQNRPQNQQQAQQQRPQNGPPNQQQGPQRGTKSVMAYDTSKLAASLNDAMKDFPNLLLGMGPSLTQMFNQGQYTSTTPSSSRGAKVNSTTGPDNSDPANCESVECSGCWFSLVEQYANQGDMEWQDVLDVQHAFNNGTNRAAGCPLPQRVSSPPPPNSVWLNDVATTIMGSDRYNRTKRQTSMTSLNNGSIGTVANVECYRRGDTLPSGGNWCGLCSMCWRFRQLPSNYFPRFINEIGCVDEDNSCLSSFGTCRLMKQPVEVMVQTSTGWSQITVQATTGCDCQVLNSSSVFNLVNN